MYDGPIWVAITHGDEKRARGCCAGVLPAESIKNMDELDVMEYTRQILVCAMNRVYLSFHNRTDWCMSD